jgi:hypothetical protein
MAMIVLGYGGVFAAITYITSMMTEVAGYTEGAVTWLLVCSASPRPGPRTNSPRSSPDTPTAPLPR